MYVWWLTDWSFIVYDRQSKTTSTSRIRAPTLSIRRACGLVLWLWCYCSWACSLCCLRASVRGRRGESWVRVRMGIRVVLILGWGMMDIRRRRLRGGLGGIGGFDEGEGFVYRSWAFEFFACNRQILKGLKGACDMSCIELWLFDLHTHPCDLASDHLTCFEFQDGFRATLSPT